MQNDRKKRFILKNSYDFIKKFKVNFEIILKEISLSNNIVAPPVLAFHALISEDAYIKNQGRLIIIVILLFYVFQ